MSLSGIRTWEWGLHIFFLSGDIDLLDDTNEMLPSLMFSYLDQQYRLFGTKASQCCTSQWGDFRVGLPQWLGRLTQGCGLR